MEPEALELLPAHKRVAPQVPSGLVRGTGDDDDVEPVLVEIRENVQAHSRRLQPTFNRFL